MLACCAASNIAVSGAGCSAPSHQYPSLLLLYPGQCSHGVGSLGVGVVNVHDLAFFYIKFHSQLVLPSQLVGSVPVACQPWTVSD